MKTWMRCVNPRCSGPSDDLIGGGFHSPGSLERCRHCGHVAVEAVFDATTGRYVPAPAVSPAVRDYAAREGIDLDATTATGALT